MTPPLIEERFLGIRCLVQRSSHQSWHGLDLSTGQPVTLKLFSLQHLREGTPVRVQRQAAILNEVRSPWLSPPLRCQSQQEALSLVLPHVPGVTLAERLSRGRLDVAEALRVARCVLAALSSVHARGVLHLGVKPSNIIVPAEGALQAATLIHFGPSLGDLGEGALREVPTAALPYLAPEQSGLLEAPVGPPADLYAVGAVLFECLAGVPPFRGDTLGALLREHLTGSPELRSLGVPVPRAVEELVQHLLRRDSHARYQSAEAALEDVEALLSALERGEHEPLLVIGLGDRSRALTEPPFIERPAELAVLEEVLERTARGQGGMLFVEGEAGSGKTALLDELVRRGHHRGFRLLRGQGVDRAAQQPFQVLTGVGDQVGIMAREQPGLRKALYEGMGEHWGIVRCAFPRLEECLAKECRSQGPSYVLPPEELAESRLIQALLRVLELLGDAEHPALMVLEDCQWADAQTLRLLSAWWKGHAEAREGGHVSVVVSFRKEEVGEGHPLRGLRPSAHVVVALFQDTELRRLVQSMAGRLPEEALAVVERLAGGNPFMAVAVVRGLVESGALVQGPSGWRLESQRLDEVRSSRQAAVLILRRFQLLAEPTRKLLAAGAILGREFEPELAALLAGLTPGQARDALREARQRHILWQEQGGLAAFVHDRLREAMLEQLSPEEFRRLHGAVAQELERRTPVEPFALSYHFDAAGQPERALPHALVAARQARKRSALDLAEVHYRIAERGAVDADRNTRQVIAEELADVLHLRLQLPAADEEYQQALRLADTPLDRARIESRRGELAFKSMDTAGAVDTFLRALRLLGYSMPRHPLVLAVSLLWELLVQAWHSRHPPRPTPGAEPRGMLLAVSLYQRLHYVYWSQQAQRWNAVWCSLRALNLAERCPPSTELARASTDHASLLDMMLPRLAPCVGARILAPVLARSRRYFRRAMALCQQLEDPLSQGRAIARYSRCLLYAARFTECIEQGRQAVALLQPLGDRWYTAFAEWSMGLAHYYRGDLLEAAHLGRRVLDEGEALGQRVLEELGLQVLCLATGGQIPQAPFATARPPSTQVGSHGSMLAFTEGVRLLRSGAPGRAVAAFEQAARLDTHSSWSSSWLATALRREALLLPPHAVAHRATLLRRARAAVREAIRRPRPFGVNLPHALREQGWLNALAGRERAARRSFDRSLACAERLEMKYERAQTLQARAEVGATLGWPDAATDAARAEEALRPMRAALDSPPAPESPVNLSLVDRFPCILEAGRRIASALTSEAALTALREAATELLRVKHFELVEAPPADERQGEPYRTAARRALEAGQPVVLSTEELDGLGASGIRSLLSAPVRVRGKPVACFHAMHDQLANLFGAPEVRIATFLATLAGTALENAQGFAEVAALSEERERLYQQTRAALRKREEFLAVASHELRTPLTPLKLHLQGLVRGMRNPSADASPERWAARAEVANARVQRFARLVEELFEFSRLEQGRLPVRREPVDLSALAAGAVEQWRGELERVRSECTVHTPGPVVGRWDGPRLEQVLDHLLSNAIKYGPGRPIEVRVEAEGGHTRLSVRDHGLGIAPEDQARIFERFERAVSEENYGGFGLGLWICREVARALGGSIGVQSMPGQGATFTVELPWQG